MTDNDRMPWGKYKNEKMVNVPADYLIWIFENANVYGEVKEYIKENIDVLKAEVKQQAKSKN